MAKSSQKTKKGAKKRRKKVVLRRTIFGLILLLIISAALTGIGYAFMVIFEIKTINVVGEVGLYSQELVVEKTGIKSGDNLFLVNLKQAQSGLEESLPYIGQAEIERKLPNTLLINVSVTQDKAFLLGQDGKYYAINEKGKILSAMSAPNETLPLVLSGGFSAELGKTAIFEYEDKETDSKKDKKDDVFSKEILEALKNILQALESCKFEGINKIDISDIHKIEMVYKERITIHVGQANSLEKKFEGAKMAIGERESYDPGVRGELNLEDKEKIIFKPENQI